LNAEQWNERYPIGTPVFAYPGARPAVDPGGEQLVTRTRSKAEVLGGHTDVVWVDGHGACIALTHVDPVTCSDEHPAMECGGRGSECSCPCGIGCSCGGCCGCCEAVCGHDSWCESVRPTPTREEMFAYFDDMLSSTRIAGWVRLGGGS
jgi:hypothetical protein